ncbi:lysophospholipase L1-like esterase [Nocardiopsis mwathae]|uniref:Lysophospholipase L1-like esterase n=1 Tax=Nocardiopsis mwathae TaxID=1472723 RepID=A0A7W9YJV2_9ACTN|nr:GDSL-type esterase/lipase family protein [Nocardiopsis mwathae]MBB6173517.1 lysophospholipase L1-like esterase [Nocardiopsis mwathae]
MRLSTALVAASALLAVGCSAAGDAAPDKRYYVSLGDSLAEGVQPDTDGRAQVTPQGYTDALFRSLYDRDSTLEHRRMGCGGEDTTTFTHGGIQRCDERYPEPSQLGAAERFLEDHRGSVALVTLDIGGNNFTGCVEEGGGEAVADVDEACVDEGLARLREEVPEIAVRLRTAAGPDVQIVGMTYYNPYLAALLLEDADPDAADTADPTPRDIAEYADDVLGRLNDTLRSAYAEAGIDVADVAEAFESENFDVPRGSESGLPVNVRRICDYTWMCDPERGPDIHTNQAGAQRIAEVFGQVVVAF